MTTELNNEAPNTGKIPSNPEANQPSDNAGLQTHRKSYELDISGLNRAEVLVALYNAAEPDGIGAIGADRRQMSLQTAEKILNRKDASGNFDHIKDKPIKLTLNSQTSIITTRIYNRDNFISAEQVIENLRKLKEGKIKENEAPDYLKSIIETQKPEPLIERMKRAVNMGRYI